MIHVTSDNDKSNIIYKNNKENGFVMYIFLTGYCGFPPPSPILPSPPLLPPPSHYYYYYIYFFLFSPSTRKTPLYSFTAVLRCCERLSGFILWILLYFLQINLQNPFVNQTYTRAYVYIFVYNNCAFT